MWARGEEERDGLKCSVRARVAEGEKDVFGKSVWSRQGARGYSGGKKREGLRGGSEPVTVPHTHFRSTGLRRLTPGYALATRRLDWPVGSSH
jgi:hypothetical protein